MRIRVLRLHGQLFLQRLDRARLADSGLADHGDDMTLARAASRQRSTSAPVRRRPTSGSVPVRIAAKRLSTAASPGARQAQHGVRKSFEFVRAGEFKVEQSAEQTLRRLTDENRVGRSEELKPRGEIGRLADDGTLLRGAEADDLADHDQAGRDPDPGPSP